MQNTTIGNTTVSLPSLDEAGVPVSTFCALFDRPVATAPDDGKPILGSRSLLDELEARATASLDHIDHASSAGEANSAREPLRKENSGVSRPARLPNA